MKRSSEIKVSVKGNNNNLLLNRNYKLTLELIFMCYAIFTQKYDYNLIF